MERRNMINMYCHGCMKFSKNKTTILKLTNKSTLKRLAQRNKAISAIDMGQPQHSALGPQTFEHSLVCHSRGLCFQIHSGHIFYQYCEARWLGFENHTARKLWRATVSLSAAEAAVVV